MVPETAPGSDGAVAASFDGAPAPLHPATVSIAVVSRAVLSVVFLPMCPTPSKGYGSGCGG
nr:hypothetical protein StreXyl84_14980 [Streptomyces sp. Xyl84]